MKGLKEYKIDIFSLSLKSHDFEFTINDRLFGYFEHSLIEKGTGNCKIKLEKSANMMVLYFDIDAKIELICDRSLDSFEYPVQLEEKLIIKFGEDNYSLSEDVIVIKEDTASIDISEFIYEYISLAVPLKKLHPRYDSDEDDEPDIVYSSETEEQEQEEKNVDPRWEALKKLKDNK